MEIREKDFNLDQLLQETLELSEFLSVSSNEAKEIQKADTQEVVEDADYLFDLADSVLENPVSFPSLVKSENHLALHVVKYPTSPGIIYRIDEGLGTFCVRGFSAQNIAESIQNLFTTDTAKRSILKLNTSDDFKSVYFFKTKTYELAESVREQIINRRFPKMEDSVCNISDPGFSWWMDVSLQEGEGRFEIFFKSHAVNRAEQYIQLGPIGDGAIAALRMNQARTLLRSSFPISEFVCSERSLSVATNKPDHLSFISFKNIFLLGENHTEEENFPDNSLGRTLYFYFHELAVIRKFWIEVQKHLS